MAETLSPARRTISHARVNAAIRLGLLVVIGIAAGITVLAAHPPYRLFGNYPAKFNAPQPMNGEGDSVVAYETISNPAIVSFPADWQVSNYVCFVVQLARTNLPTHPTFDDYVPQQRWDTPPDAALVIDQNTIFSFSNDGSAMKLIDDRLISMISTRTSYQVQWMLRQPIAVYPDQTVGGLICTQFQASDGSTHVPVFFQLGLFIRNTYVSSYPAYYFTYHDSVPATGHPPVTLELQSMPFDEYMGQLLENAPFAVRLQNVAASTP